MLPIPNVANSSVANFQLCGRFPVASSIGNWNWLLATLATLATLINVAHFNDYFPMGSKDEGRWSKVNHLTT